LIHRYFKISSAEINDNNVSNGGLFETTIAARLKVRSCLVEIATLFNRICWI